MVALKQVAQYCAYRVPVSLVDLETKECVHWQLLVMDFRIKASCFDLLPPHLHPEQALLLSPSPNCPIELILRMSQQTSSWGSLSGRSPGVARKQRPEFTIFPFLRAGSTQLQTPGQSLANRRREKKEVLAETGN